MKENAVFTSLRRHAVSCNFGRSRAAFDRQRVLIGRTTAGNRNALGDNSASISPGDLWYRR